jgi:hypothetical protein
MEIEMMDVLEVSQPTIVTAVGILEAARDRVKVVTALLAHPKVSATTKRGRTTM